MLVQFAHSVTAALVKANLERYAQNTQTGKLAVVTKPLAVLRSGDLDLSKKARTKVVLKKNVMEVCVSPDPS